MSILIDTMLRTWERQKDYAQRLLADLSDEDMVAQPVPGVTLNHPAWTVSHLTVYSPVLSAILRETPFKDPMLSRFGRDSKPEADLGAYPRRNELVAEYLRVHDELAAALRTADPAVLDKPIPLERWRERFPFIADAIMHLMINHESGHLGQISAWRRAGGRGRV
jgi:hypothetical protein